MWRVRWSSTDLLGSVQRPPDERGGDAVDERGDRVRSLLGGTHELRADDRAVRAGPHDLDDLLGAAHAESDAHVVVAVSHRFGELTETLGGLLRVEGAARAQVGRLEVDDGALDRARGG